ncbi:aspartate/glutamate racemase family protein [Marinomonas sp. 15G1-11]|uniref:Aspartate/glutamate racemase family protein n=1 Tax=Marinomonas phaeophyticola TaxID=3004091 RepID=A0ABT4JV47_9GAMM|nr:aspartate/glutamate racemase family protein [Marinomonas sp. 15G1-11]MCZ2721424.1 aspartate/glutamate racemase family protein [Marinomonas sp. 15G1-11]
MKTIGLIGGMSWESTASYYRLMNQGVRSRLGGLHSARICLYSVDFAEIEVLQRTHKWQEAAAILMDAAGRLESAGADYLLICTNTMHKVFAEVQASITIPVVHIVDATAKQLKQDGITKVGLLGTRFTMEDAFYKDRMQQDHGIDVLVPDQTQRDLIHEIIYQELCLGEIKDTSREQYLNVIQSLYAQGAEAIILGCTEIALLVQPQHTTIPLYDTTAIHANDAVDMALE